MKFPIAEPKSWRTRLYIERARASLVFTGMMFGIYWGWWQIQKQHAVPGKPPKHLHTTIAETLFPAKPPALPPKPDKA